MNKEQIEYVKRCLLEDTHMFYVWTPWKHKRKEVLDMDKHECQLCKQRGIYTKANTVHHVNYLRKYPELALEIWYEWRGRRKRNLISLCHDCHEEVHGYRKKNKEEPLTQERW